VNSQSLFLLSTMNLIFDLDGTLINSLPGIAQSLNRSLEQYELPTHNLEAVRAFIGSGSRMLCQRAVKSPSTEIVDKLEAAFKENYQKLWKAGTDVYADIPQLLETLSEDEEHELSILSNKPNPFTQEIASELFSDGTFHTVLGQRDGIEKKPDPKGIQEILDHATNPNQHSYLIGDSIIDLQTARNASIGSITVLWGFEDLTELKAESPTHIVKSPNELLNLIYSLQ